MPLEGLRWSRDSGSALCDTSQNSRSRTGWGNFTQWREHQDWEEADLKYRALKMVLPSDDPNVRYIEKNFSVCSNKEVIENVRTRVNIYEDSIRYHNEMIQMAAIKDSMANSLFKEANEIKKKINKK